MNEETFGRGPRAGADSLFGQVTHRLAVAIVSGVSSLLTADQTMPTPTLSSNKPKTKEAAFSKRWWP